MLKLAKIFSPLFIVFIIFQALPAQAAGTAIMRLSSVKTDYILGDNIYIDIMVEPNGESLNVARAVINFSGVDTLLINDFSLNYNSGFNQSPVRILDNTSNLINLGGFILVGSIPQNPPATKLGTLIFKANQAGSATINFVDGSHLISLTQQETINLPGCQGITINVADTPPLPNRTPVFDPVSNKSIELGQSVSFHVRATDPDGDKVTLSTDIPVDANFNNVTTGPVAEGDFSWAPNEKGIFNLIFYGTDDNPIGSKTGNLTVKVNVSTPVPLENQAPIFQPVTNKSIKLGETINFHVQAVDPDGDKVNLTWNIPTGAVFSNVVNNATTANGDFTWKPTSEGIYTATFIAQDDADPNSKSRTLSVSIGVSVPPNHAPVFEPLTEKTVNAGETLTFNVSATDPDGDNVNLSLEPLENAKLVSISQGSTATSRFEWVPSNSGIYYVSFKALDNNPYNPLSSTVNIRITVFGGQCPPCISGGGGGGGTCPLPQCEKQDFGQPLIHDPVVINSPSHANSQRWYSNNEPQFIWEAIDPGLGYIFNLDQNPLSDPTFGYFFSQEKAFAFSAVPDGFWYFHIKVKYLDGYGPTAHYQVKVDTTPPELFNPSVEGSKIYFSSLDKFSGVSYYEMKIDDGDWQKVQSPYIITNDDRNSEIMIIRAVDKAGNVVESRIDLTKMEVIKEEQKKYIIDQPEFVVAVPIIDLIAYPLIYGKALPGSKVYVFISSEPQTIIYTSADDQGNWLAYIDKKLTAGKYEVYAISNFNNTDSEPSEKVYFAVSKPQVAGFLSFPWKFDLDTLGLIAGILVAACILMLAGIKFAKFLIKMFLKRFGEYLEIRKLNGNLNQLTTKVKKYGRKKKK